MKVVSSNEGAGRPSTSPEGFLEQGTEDHNKQPTSDPDSPTHSARASTPVENLEGRTAAETNSHPPATNDGVSESTSPSARPLTSQFPPGANTPSTATSYFPSTATLTSFFSSGSKPKSTTSPPPSGSSGSSAPVLEQKVNLTSETRLSAPANQQSLEGSPNPPSVDLGGLPMATSALKRKPASPSSQTPPSSLSALMIAAVPYLGARKASKPSLLPPEGSALAVPDQGGISASTDRIRSTEDVPQAGVTSSADRPSSANLPSSDMPPLSDSSSTKPQPESTSSETRLPGPSPQADLSENIPQENSPLTSFQAAQASTSSHSPGQEGSPQVLPPGTSAQAPPHELSPQAIPPSSFSEAPPGATSPQTIPPGTSYQVIPPATSSQAILPTTSPQAIPLGISTQAPAPSTFSQANSPGTSYLSMPSFLPSWSTITAQLPSLPSTSFTNREQGPTSLSPSLPKQDVGSQGDSKSEVGLAKKLESFPPFSGPVPQSSILSKPSTLSNPPNLQPHDKDEPPPLCVSSPAPLASSGNPSSQPIGGASQTGGKEQAPPRRELDPPSAAAADEIAGGIASVFGPVTREADKQVEAALRSQEKLALSIDRLTKGLDKLLEETPQPLVAQQAARLAHIRKRVQSLASTLKVIQGRIDSMNWALDRKSARAPSIRGRSATAPNSPQSHQAFSQPFEQVRQFAPQRWAAMKTEKDTLEPPTTSAHSSTEAELKESNRAAEMIGSSRRLSGKPSSRSPEKGHRRAMSHDVRSSTAMLNKR